MDPDYLDVHWKRKDHEHHELKRDYMKSIYSYETQAIPSKVNIVMDPDYLDVHWKSKDHEHPE